MRGSPPQGDELSIGEESPPKEGTKTKKIAGRRLPDGEVSRPRDRGTVRVLMKVRRSN